MMRPQLWLCVCEAASALLPSWSSNSGREQSVTSALVLNQVHTGSITTGESGRRVTLHTACIHSHAQGSVMPPYKWNKTYGGMTCNWRGAWQEAYLWWPLLPRSVQSNWSPVQPICPKMVRISFARATNPQSCPCESPIRPWPNWAQKIKTPEKSRWTKLLGFACFACSDAGCWRLVVLQGEMFTSWVSVAVVGAENGLVVSGAVT